MTAAKQNDDRFLEFPEELTTLLRKSKPSNVELLALAAQIASLQVAAAEGALNHPGHMAAVAVDCNMVLVLIAEVIESRIKEQGCRVVAGEN